MAQTGEELFDPNGYDGGVVPSDLLEGLFDDGVGQFLRLVGEGASQLKEGSRVDLIMSAVAGEEKEVTGLNGDAAQLKLLRGDLEIPGEVVGESGDPLELQFGTGGEEPGDRAVAGVFIFRDLVKVLHDRGKGMIFAQ